MPVDSDSVTGWKSYEPGTDNDLPLLTWYSLLCNDGSLEKAFGPSLWALGPFMKSMVDTTTGLLYAEDEQGWWGVSWFTPVMGGLSWGFWIREDYRGPGRYEKVALVMETLNAAFQMFPLVLAPTKQTAVRDLALRFGFVDMGQIPHLFEGEPCFIIYQTREGFEPIFAAWSEQHGTDG